jgi:hypothetical protein
MRQHLAELNWTVLASQLTQSSCQMEPTVHSSMKCKIKPQCRLTPSMHKSVQQTHSLFCWYFAA